VTPLKHGATLYQNGEFHVFSDKIRVREALASYQGRVIFVGDKERARRAFPAGVTPTVVDLGGKPVLPGFIDSHLHLMNLGLSLRNLALEDVRSIEDLKAKVREHASKIGDDEWILGRGWDQERFRERRYPTRKDLDEAAPGRPVCLSRVCGHLSVLSSAALELAGITRDTPDPEGGAIDRDDYGDPTGILREKANALTLGVIPEVTEETRLACTMEAMRCLLSKGITSVHTNDHGDYVTVQGIYQAAHSQGIPLRIYWDMPREALDGILETPLRTGDGDDYFRIGAVKVFSDGSLGGRTAALEAPYADDRSTSGILVTDESALKDAVYLAHAAGMQVAIHAIGDRATRISLAAINEAQSRIPRTSLRHRIVHAQILAPLLISEMKRTGVVVDVQPKFITTDMRWAQERVGAQRMRSSYAWRTMLKAGIPMAGGSDSPVEPPDTLFGIYAAVTRRDMEGNPPGGFYPNERISVSEAIRMFTLGGAYGAFEEDSKGTLEPGKLADFVVLSDDPFTVVPEDIRNIEVLMTVVGGQVAYEKP
jgi:predicted amidohydrolase YtcJ